MEREILHVDVNNAFLSWTAVDMLANGYKVDIRTIPAIIGGDESLRHGVVLAKSPVAKQFQIKTGEPIFFARKKCPNIQVFKSDFQIYKKYSNNLYTLLLEYTDKIERFSIDECFLDITQYLNGRNSLEIANEISKRVREELKFTVNIGIAHNKLLAKMASDFQKPNKIHTLITDEEIHKKMWSLPVSELFMVGKRTIPKLNNLGIRYIGDLARFDENILIKKLGKYGRQMWEYANGIDNSEVENIRQEPKGIGNSITLPEDVSKIEKLDEILLSLVEQVTYRLRKHNLLAQVVNIQLKTNKFKVYSHQRKIDYPEDTTKGIYIISKQLLKDLYTGEPIRLVGIRVEKLCGKNEVQLSLFTSQKDKKQEKLDETMDLLNEKYGRNCITRAGKMNLNKNINLKE